MKIRILSRFAAGKLGKPHGSILLTNSRTLRRVGWLPAADRLSVPTRIGYKDGRDSGCRRLFEGRVSAGGSAAGRKALRCAAAGCSAFLMLPPRTMEAALKAAGARFGQIYLCSQARTDWPDRRRFRIAASSFSLGGRGKTPRNGPAADERPLKTSSLSASIRVCLRPICLFHQPVRRAVQTRFG